jgi:DNA-binding NtrC family response regulator
MSKDTLPLRAAGVPLRGIRVEVVRGPDRGRVSQATREVVAIGTADGNDLVLTDPTVSRYHVEIGRGDDRLVVRDLGSTNGTVLGPVLVRDQTVAVLPGTTIELGQTALRVDDGKVVLLEVRPQGALGGLRGRSLAMQRVMATVERLARKDVAVLVVGESGTGKEVVARALHEAGPRARGPFVTVDCGAVTSSLFPDELFGHDRGAFTGADRRQPGAFERAHGGTLFLDEVGELPPALQSALLGVLERGRFRRVGGTEEVPVDVRVVGATNRDLRAQVNSGAFRLDLYYRLAVVVVAMPPLRERADDISLLVEHFLREEGHDGPVEAVVPPGLMDELRGHSWPGNVRELRNFVEALLATGQPALDGVLGAPVAAPPCEATTGDVVAGVLDRPYREARGAVIADFEARYLRRLLERSAGGIRRAAREARMDRTYLVEMLRRHGLA